MKAQKMLGFKALLELFTILTGLFIWLNNLLIVLVNLLKMVNGLNLGVLRVLVQEF